ncbi:glutathione S-transferase [Aspergillus fijiensis CBS 313.89]|uniref:glutathione transferase n=1 Tax=Aspergillus fijiensis CBS 313.89 TaxID=1448319 RepID=A0A8G1VTW7_9EURO|nr:glutathione S-transferase [Aspergillus fijiensis CBS 313.89]RAK71478.1 glutathione S-transferase [Aspergillus fijiensis CBS 313.89]
MSATNKESISANCISLGALPAAGRNPWKVVLILEELGVSYKTAESFKFDYVKDKPYIDICPNGRVPAIETYESEKEITHESLNERYLLNQSLHFQMSGQGPYYGQSGWFNVLHPERLPSVIERYNGPVRRVLSVLETFLGGEKTWLVRDKCTFADLSFMPWNTRLDFVLMTKPGEDPLAPYPNVQAWHKRMVERPAWKRAMAVRDKLMNDQGLMPNGMPKGINNIKEYEEYREKLAAKAQEAKQAV